VVADFGSGAESVRFFDNVSWPDLIRL
jgi:hypothetical protein